jgi:hypothetical protein
MDIRAQLPREPRLRLHHVEGLALNLPIGWIEWTHHALVNVRPELERYDQELREYGYQVVHLVKWTSEQQLIVIVIPIWVRKLASCIHILYRCMWVMGLAYALFWILPYIGYIILHVLVIGGGYMIVGYLLDLFTYYVVS